MNARSHPFVTVCWTLLLALPGAQSLADARISIRADAPNASIQPRAAGKNLIRLPSLVYSFSLRAECPDDHVPESLLVNVADTRKSFGTAEIVAGELLALELHIPAAQIAPVGVEDFCAIPIAADGSTDVVVSGQRAQLTLYDVLSAQASLMCANDSGSTITYVSQALHVILICELLAAENAGDSAG